MILEPGPARETQIMSFLGSLSLLGSTGTGFAHPKWARNIRRVPNGSRWAIGFNVILPMILAVLSPNFSATHPCATS
jgi:hypothetical protein